MSDSILAARTDMAGFRMREEKSSRLKVRSVDVKLRSTPFWVATWSVTLWLPAVANVATAFGPF